MNQPLVGDLPFAKRQRAGAFDCGQVVLQPQVSHCLFGKSQTFQVHAGKVYQPRGGDFSKAVIEILQLGQRLQMFQPRVSDFSNAEIEILQLGQSFEMDQLLVGDWAPAANMQKVDLSEYNSSHAEMFEDAELVAHIRECIVMLGLE